MSADDLAREGLALIGNSLLGRGWSRVSGTDGQFERVASEQITARFDYAVAKFDRPTKVKVTPYVGVAHEQVEEVRRQVFGKTSYTINMQIQQLMHDPIPEGRWVFNDRDRDTVAALVMADSMEFGWPFIRRFNNLDSIVEGLEGMNRGKRTIMSHSLTIAYCLEGRLDDAVHEFAPDVEYLKEHPTFPGLGYVSRLIDTFHLSVVL